MTGKKGRSGRKRSTDIAPARELIARAVPDASRREILDRLVELALGDGPIAVVAAQLLMFYAFGIPVQDLAGAVE